ncbi:QRFP-like peptide receptor [Mya arenaria]|uniref:QRFP-like peptide receptor n=1 Tax=Mya arenaria TaxID=6604 RepID=UPI0022E7B4C9|nr:QRFP-like peptide receptor [Mya arenaria]
MDPTKTTSVSFQEFAKVVCLYYINCFHPGSGEFCSRMFPEQYRKMLEEPDVIRPESNIILVIMYSIITIMSLVGNSLVVITFAVDKHMRSVTNVFILSLAVVDLMVTLTCVPFNIDSAYTTHWMFGRFTCKVVPFFRTFSESLHLLTMCVIAFDRYFAIVHPHRLKSLRKPAQVSTILVLIWMVSLLCSVPNAVFYNLKKLECPHTKTEDVYICVWPDEHKPTLGHLLTLVALFIIPLIIMTVVYGLIGLKLWIRKPAGESRGNSLRNATMKKGVIKMLVIVILAYLVCWSPIIVLNFVESLLDKAQLNLRVMVYLKLYFQCLSMVSCCINPIIYTFMNKKFREKFASYIRCCRSNKVRILTVS